MRKTLLVGIYEVVTTLTRRSFLIVTFGLPLVSALIFFIVSSLNPDTRDSITSMSGLASSQGSAATQNKPDGYIDRSGLILSIPSAVPDGELIEFADEAAAQDALNKKSIRGYYLIPLDYLHTGEIIYVRFDYNPLSASEQSGLIEWVLRVNLLGGDVRLANQISDPLDLEVTVLEPPNDRDQDNPLSFFLPYGVTFIYYLIILASASLLLNSITKEKENRMIEIMMLATTPRQLLAGKFMGLGLIGLLQAILWLGTGFVLLRFSGTTFQIPEAYQLPISFLIWGLIFFLLGYAVFASLMAGIGALVPNIREASQVTLIVMAPLLLPLMLISVLVRDPNGGLAVGLSLFPFTAPVTMMMRLSATEVPLWQTLLSIVILVITAILILRIVARVFRTQTLLSGQSLNVRKILDTLKPYGKAQLDSGDSGK